MTTRPRGVRAAVTATAFLLAAVTLVATGGPPASAATTRFSQSQVTYVGGLDAQPSNEDDITVPDVSTANHYPSSLTISHAGDITDLDVELFGVDHAFPDDLDVLLVGPHGQMVNLMSDAGAGGDLTDATLRFDDESLNSLPDEAAITMDNYKPANYEGIDAFPSPAPTNTGGTSLSVFDGTDPVGTWRLYIRDQGINDAGFISGWKMYVDQDSSVYPSDVTVSGLPAITDVNVNLTNIKSTYPDDADLLLVSPGGQQATIMSDAGGGVEVNGLNLTIDDEAGGVMPDDGPLANGATYQPTNSAPAVDAYGAPAPTSTGTTALSVFDGTIPNGTWHLFISDDGTNDWVQIGGWSLDFSWDDAVSPSGSFTINNGAATTSSPQATLNLNAVDPAPSSGLQMRVSNDGVTFSAYKPYASTSSWTLTAGEGTKTVHVQFRDGDGNLSSVVTDTIKLAIGPRAKKVVPAKNKTGVAVGTNVTIKASEALRASSVTGSTVWLSGNGSKVAAKVTYSAGTKTITINPNAALRHHVKYTVNVKNAKDLKGNKWDEKPSVAGATPLKCTFTTG